MTFRKIDTCMWTKPWFEKLSPNAKLGFVYLWSNDYCNQAGFYTISPDRINFDLGYGIDTIYNELDSKVEWFPEKSIVWVKNFFKHQCQNSKFAISALNSIQQDSFRLQLFIKYNKDILMEYKDELEKCKRVYHIDTI